MDLVSDILLAAGAFGAAVYCYVLSARLKRFTALESGMGGAIAVLSAQVDDMTRALQQAREAAQGSAADLRALTDRGESQAARLELLLASLHDLPDPSPADPGSTHRETDTDKRLRFVRRRNLRDPLEAAE